MDTLREQCPWDQAQTHASLMPHLVEETYEVLDALAALEESGGAAAYVHLEEELEICSFRSCSMPAWPGRKASSTWPGWPGASTTS